jgi:hypothetical protein
MGLGVLHLLTGLKRQGHIPNGSAVIEIGAQQLDDSFFEATANIAEVAQLFGVTSPLPSLARAGASDPANPLTGAPLARDFWAWLGLDYASVDIDGSPGSVPLDLNYDEVPTDLVGKYDVVTNFGTTEHVANQVQAFKIMHDLAAVDAVMLHLVPAGGMPNHGLVSYNPKFFWMLGRSNGYKIVLMTMSRSDIEGGMPRNVLDYLSAYDLEVEARFADYRTPETALLVAFQKVYDTPFVAPIDVDTGTTTEHATLRERYWTVFTPAPFVPYERLGQRVRRWSVARSPRWLIAAKRRLFGTRVPGS